MPASGFCSNRGEGVPARDAASPARPRRRWFGLRDAPGRLALALLRLPLRSARSGHLPGRTFVVFTHRGRTSGETYQTVAMVLRQDACTGEVVVCAAWGADTDWVKNLRAAPAEAVQLGRATFVPEQRFRDEHEAAGVIRDFWREHPVRSRVLRAVLGCGDLGQTGAARAFARTHPFVAFRRAADGVR